MDDKPITASPMSSGDRILRDKFAESIAGQSELMDRLGQQLITLELAVPGLFATVLKLVSGEQARVTLGTALYVTFGCWLLALLFTLISLIPRRWKVDPQIMLRDTFDTKADLGIHDFFNNTARYKRRLLIASSLLFFVGIIIAAHTAF